jgi:8-oxo-dGTP pyrophosphatase MutT (NUDIX family)
MEATQSNIQEYVCGFLFFYDTGQQSFEYIMSPEKANRKVLLILKDRPAWQAGKYNGIGGKIELGEKPIEAMTRECFEESGLKIKDWQQYAIMEGPGYRVYFFKAFQDSIEKWQQRTTEALAAFPSDKLPPNLINSNRYLIPLALEKDMVEAIIRTQ